MIDGVVFDLGGVVLESPLDAIAGVERSAGIPVGAVNRAIAAAGADGAWARLERGELAGDGFHASLTAELSAAGIRLDTRELMDGVEAAIVARPEMIAEVRRLRSTGLVVAACTNNWHPFEGELPSEFDVFVESVVEGTRKPEPEIYRRVVERMGVPPGRLVMLDDLGPNLKPARQMGMATIKVESPEQALRDLRAVLGFGYRVPSTGY